MVITRVGPLSAAKIVGVLYVAIGVVIGLVFACIGLVGAAAAFQRDAGGGAFGALFGIAAIVVFPVFYGGLGFVVTLVMTSLFNVAASLVGGVEISIDSTQ
jgi:hypothetical protein